VDKYNKEILFRNKKTIIWILILSFIVLLPNIFLACHKLKREDSIRYIINTNMYVQKAF